MDSLLKAIQSGLGGAVNTAKNFVQQKITDFQTDQANKAWDYMREKSPIPQTDILTSGLINMYQSNNDRQKISQPMKTSGIRLDLVKSPKAEVKGVTLAPTRAPMTPTPTPPPPVQSVNNNVNLNEDVLNFLENTVFPITREYGIPDAVAAGQFAAEGRFNHMGARRNNFYNIAAYDGKESQMPGYSSPEQGVAAYAKLIATNPRYAKAMASSEDPAEMVRQIKMAGYATRPDYAQFIMSTPEFKAFYKKR